MLARTFGDQALLADYADAIAAGHAPGHLAVVAGAIAAAVGVDRSHAVLAEMRGVAVMVLSAAVRLGVVPAAASQAMLAGLVPEIVAATRIALQTPLDEMECSAAAGLEIAAMRHSRSDARLFAS